jgi:DHA1 family bicyclomycin/chloramphenicol resistance-like MFS transporter
MAISSIGNGMSQPPGVAAGLSVYPRIAGAASGLLGFMQMAVAALGTLLLGLLPRDSVLAMVAVVGASLALALVCGLFTLRAAAEGPRLAGAPGSSRGIVKGS